jgi:pimeloyl-ACP methyl ester carboxylesterase
MIFWNGEEWKQMSDNLQATEGRTLLLPDGRTLGYLCVGEGKPVFYFHGLLIGSRLDVLNMRYVAAHLKLQLIGVDRPGVGLSSFTENRRLCDFAADIRFLADHLHLELFSIVGVSGGGHYAITCGALFPERLSKVLVIMGFALPLNVSDMQSEVKMLYTMMTNPLLGTLVLKKVRETTLEMVKDPDSFMKSDMGRRVLGELGDVQLTAELQPRLHVGRRSIEEFYRQGDASINALIHEVNLMKNGWDVDLSTIPSGLVHIYHSTADPSSPVSNAYRNAQAIPGAQLEIIEGKTHLLALKNLEEILTVLR